MALYIFRIFLRIFRRRATTVCVGCLTSVCLVLVCCLNVIALLRQIYYLHIIRDINPHQYWLQHKQIGCNGRMSVYGEDFAVFTNMTVFPGKRFSSHIECNDQSLQNVGFRVTVTSENHLNDWLSSTLPVDKQREKHVLTTSQVSTTPTIGIVRYEYASLYHQMTDFYNTFLVLKLLNISPEDVNILLVDNNPPRGIIEGVWGSLFKNVDKISNLKDPIFYQKFIWGMLGYNSPLSFDSLLSVPYAEEFSNFFKSKHGVTKTQLLDCSQLTIRIIWRRDYVSHPGNPIELISRKIKNEHELVSALKERFPSHVVAGTQLDVLSMSEQVSLISKTDVLVGMHGAGMSHIINLPSNASVIELYPLYQSSLSRHFQAMARWRRLHYTYWQNRDESNDLRNKFTYIPANVLVEKVKELLNRMCPSAT